jgi:molybdenum cofactor synthesis domain-containing protein
VRVPLGRTAGAVLAEPLVARLDLPPFSNSAMDGFAVCAADLAQRPGRPHKRARLRIAGRIAAGDAAHATLTPGQAWAIATGATLPEGADAVVRIEDALVEGSPTVEGSWADGAWMEAAVEVRPGMNVRHRGEDVAAGDVLAEPGTRMGPGQLAAAAAAGVASLLVHPRPSVAIIPTGDEVSPPGCPLPPGHVHDAVSIPLAALLEEAGAVPAPLPVVADRPDAVQAAVRAAAGAHDLVVTIGGVSVGARDFVGHNAGLPEIQSVRLALRPARPFAFGRIGRAVVLCLPGNPGSALVAFEELVRPVVLALAGRPPRPRPSVSALLAEPLVGKPGKVGVVPCKVWAGPCRPDGSSTLMARRAGRGGPISALADANAWAVIPADRPSFPAGATIEVRLLSDIAAAP